MDQGGHASRALVFDTKAQCVTSYSVSIETITRADGYIEHDPAEMIASVKDAISAVIKDLGADAKRIHSAGIATQRSTIVCWDRQSGKALSPIISWQDRRAKDYIDALSGRREEVRARTGLFPNPHYGASKMRWCLDNIPSVGNAKELSMGPLSTFILFHLLENRPFVADVANGSRTLLVNLQTLDWDSEMLNVFGIERTVLPDLVDTIFSYGKIQIDGLPIPLQVCTGDQSAAFYAQGEPAAGSVSVNAGTGAFMQTRVNDAATIPNRLLASPVFRLGEERLLVMEGTVNGAARALDLYAEELDALNYERKLQTWCENEKEIPVFLNGVSGLGSPYWQSEFESRFIGEGSKPARMVAILESILFLLMRNLEEMKRQGEPLRSIGVSGGLSNIDYFCQGLADLSGLPVRRAEMSEATSLGVFRLLNRSESLQITSPAFETFSPATHLSLCQRHSSWCQNMPSLL